MLRSGSRNWGFLLTSGFVLEVSENLSQCVDFFGLFPPPSLFLNASNTACFVKFWLWLDLEVLKQHLTELPEKSDKAGERTSS